MLVCLYVWKAATQLGPSAVMDDECSGVGWRSPAELLGFGLMVSVGGWV